MSRTPCFFLEKFNSTKNCYELCHPYVWNRDNTELVPAELFPYNGCHDVFSIAENRGNDFPEMYGIHKGLPADVSKEVKTEYQKYYDDDDYPYHPTVRWFTYADMYIYLLKNPTVFNDENEQSMENPMEILKSRIDSFLDVMDEDWHWNGGYSRVRIVYWID